jgi:hypothetical protein
MDEKGFMMGAANRCKVTCRRGRRIPRLTHNSSCTWVTVIAAVSAAGVLLPPLTINEGAGHYKGWYSQLGADDIATFSYSPKGCSDQELGMEWLVKNFQPYTVDR